MGATDRYVEQHQELLAIAGRIAGMLDPSKISRDAAPVRKELSSLIVKLKVHLTMEDNALYPALLNHPDTNVRGTAKVFQEQMGSIAKVVLGYNEKWASAADIQASASEFIADTKSIYAALGQRIEKENNQLYPLLG